MSDYLSRAAERVSGTNAAIRPALPSLFEPEKHEDVAAAPSSPESRSNVEVEPASNTAEKNAGAVSGIQERVTSVLALAPETPAAVTPAEKSKSKLEQKFGDVVPPKVRGDSRELESSSEKSSFPERSDMRPRVAQSIPVVEPSAETKESPPHSRATRSQAGVEPSVELPHELPPQRSPQPDRPRVIERVTKDLQSPIPVTPASRRRIVSIRPTQRQNPVRSADRESSSERTIHVTIGRLEVRAVQSAPARPKPVPPRPRISLEEYLRSRNRGAE
jgi:hypothetical protein